MKFIVIVILLMSSQSAMASVLPGVLTALGDSASDTILVAGMVLMIYIGITAMRYIRMTLRDGDGGNDFDADFGVDAEGVPLGMGTAGNTQLADFWDSATDELGMVEEFDWENSDRR